MGVGMGMKRVWGGTRDGGGEVYKIGFMLSGWFGWRSEAVLFWS